jgi:5'-nucleotidase
VIALTHIGYTEHNPGDVIDPVLCSKTRNIDLFVTGHSHTFLEEMVYHPNLDGIPVPVVQDGWMGVYMGQIDYRLTVIIFCFVNFNRKVAAFRFCFINNKCR